MRGGAVIVVAMAGMGLALLHPRTAVGQPTPGTQPVSVAAEVHGRARAALDQGLVFLRQQRWIEALPHLEESVRLEPTPIGWFNLGLAYRGAGRIAGAIDAFDRYLASPEPDAPQARLNALRTERPNLLRSVATMQINVVPGSATIRIDGRAASLTAGSLHLDAGAHALEFEAPGHAPVRREVSLQAGATTVLDLQLPPLAGAAVVPPSQTPVTPPTATPVVSTTGQLIVEPSVASASVSIDGVARGQGPVSLALPAGDHRVEVRAVGYQPWSHAAVVRAGGTSRLAPTLAGQGGGRGWILPVAIAGGAVVVTAAVVAVAVLTRGTASPTAGTWNTVQEQ